MLINTLFLFLRELLPLFLLWAMLVVLIEMARYRNRVLIGGVVTGTVLYFSLQLVLDEISQCLEGTGLEWLFFAVAAVQLVLLGLSMLMLSGGKKPAVMVVWTVMLALFTASSLVKFMTFLISLWAQQVFHQPLVIGIVIGAAISASIAVLFYFFLYGLRRVLPISTLVFLALFLSGHLASAVSLLEQIGLIDGAAIWSTQRWLPDQSAVALVISAMLGYEATPSFWQVIIYVLVLVVMLAIIGWRRQALLRVLTQREGIA